MRSLRCGLAAGLICFGSAQAQSPDPVSEEEDLRLAPVEVAGLRPVPTNELAGSVTVLDMSDLLIRDQPYLADQLRAVPGLAVSRSGAVGGLTQVRIRGSEANHTLVLLDGIEVSDPTTGETDFGLLSGLYPARVEVARGEQSALFGSDAIGGVIQIVSAQEAGLRGLIEVGTYGTHRTDLTVGHDLENGYVGLTLARSRTEGVDTSGRGGEKDGGEASSLLATGTIGVGGGWQLNGLLRYADDRTGNDSDRDFDGRLDDTNEEAHTQQWTAGAALRGRQAGLDHQLRLAWSEIERTLLDADIQTGETLGERVKWTYSPSHQFDLAGGQVRMTGLVDWEKETYQRIGEASFFGDPNQAQAFETLGLSAEAHFSRDRWTLTGSVRQDDNRGRFEDATSWRVGTAWRTGRTGKLRASAGAGVKNPTFTELFGFFPGSFIGNPDLLPERSTSWEVGLDQTLGATHWSVTYFEASLEDEIFTAFNPDFTSTARNRTGQSDRSGVEASGSLLLNEQLALGASLSVIESRDDQGDAEIRVPEWTGSLQLSWTAADQDGWRAGFAADYVGHQDDLDFGTFRRVELDAYWLVSATLDIPVTERLSVTVRGNNLLNQDVTDVFGYHQPGRALLFGLRAR